MRLLDLDLGAGLLELLGDLLGLVLGDGFLDLLGSAVDHVLGVLEAKTGNRANLLDDGDLVGTSGLQDDVELGLLFSGGSTSARSGNGDGGSGGNAPRLFESLNELVDFENGLTGQFVDDFFVRHFRVSFLLQPSAFFI